MQLVDGEPFPVGDRRDRAVRRVVAVLGDYLDALVLGDRGEPSAFAASDIHG